MDFREPDQNFINDAHTSSGSPTSSNSSNYTATSPKTDKTDSNQSGEETKPSENDDSGELDANCAASRFAPDNLNLDENNLEEAEDSSSISPEKTPQQLHEELVAKIHKSKWAANVKKMHLAYKREVYKGLASEILVFHSSLLGLGINKKAELEARIREVVIDYLPEFDSRKFIAKMATKFSSFTQQELDILADKTIEWCYEAKYTLIVIPNKEVIFGAIKHFEANGITPQKTDIQNYRQEVDPTRIKADLAGNEFYNRYLELANKACKDEFDSEKIGKIIDSIKDRKREELSKRDEYIEGMKIPVVCGDIVQYLVEVYPQREEQIKKLCPDIYKRKNALEKKLEAEINLRQQLENKVKELQENNKILTNMKNLLVSKGTFTEEELKAFT